MTISRRTLILPPLVLPLHARAQSPAAATVERLHAALIDVMKSAAQLGVRGREARLRPVMQTAFDLAAMSRIAVGSAWTGFSPEQQAAVTQAFSDWSIATYANRFDGYGGERFETENESTLANGDRIVRTRLVRSADAAVQLNYVMRGAPPRIVDVLLIGTISELASRRAEFTVIVREGGAERLANELRTRTAVLLR